ncbi:MAG: hypothetical protein ICV68_16520 [Pyrinomonadaceae bacterium]|nr:hypothetical protein [Pyrinomonadaceae bacterium]
MDITKSVFLDAANKFADEERRKGIWVLWAKYDIRRHKDGQRYVLAVEPSEAELPPRVGLAEALEKTNGTVAPGSPEEELMRQARKRTELRKEGWVYWPLVRHLELFLTFAGLADDGGLDNAATVDELDTDKNASVTLDWAQTYGILGLTPVEVDGFRGASTRGGEADTVASFAHEAWVANGCLRLYEAATAEELDMDLIASYIAHPRYKSRYTRSPAIARESALDAVATETQKRVAGRVYPALYGVVGKFTSGWTFTNLLGAMWLQMFWLLTASETPRRCKQCDNIIAYEQPDQPTQGAKKRGRKKERFCSKQCSDRYTYLTKTRPRRRAGEAGGV